MCGNVHSALSVTVSWRVQRSVEVVLNAVERKALNASGGVGMQPGEGLDSVLGNASVSHNNLWGCNHALDFAVDAGQVSQYSILYGRASPCTLLPGSKLADLKGICLLGCRGAACLLHTLQLTPECWRRPTAHSGWRTRIPGWAQAGNGSPSQAQQRVPLTWQVRQPCLVPVVLDAC